MKTDTLIKEINKFELNIQKYFDKKFDGACPCFWGRKSVEGYYITLHGHCWRTTGNSLVGGCKCSFNGLHIKSKMPLKKLKPIIKAIKEQLDSQKWYSEWEVVYE
jgi:hypothetical protein